MGFPIKKRIAISANANMDEGPAFSSPSSSPAPSGLDLLLGAIDSASTSSTTTAQGPQHAMAMPSPRSVVAPAPRPARSTSDATFISSSTAEECNSSGSDNDETPKVSRAKAMSAAYNSTYDSTSSKRAKTFPEILMDILSNPDYVPIVSWLPHGKSFAIHDPAEFSSIILPKYFRRVIFRSFIRKLNRWGFRSVKRSVSGFESTFEHKLFSRDDPDSTSKMYCKSNPSSKAATAKGGAADGATSCRNAQAVHTVAQTAEAVVSPSTSTASAVSAMSAATSASATQAPQHQQFMNSPSAAPINSTPISLSRNEEFPLQLSNELMMREIQCRRQRALMQLVHRMPVSEADIVNQYVEEKWRMMLAQQQMEQRMQRGDDLVTRLSRGL